MIPDTSAMVAIVMKEPGYEEFLRTMAGGNADIGTVTLTETVIVLPERLQSGAHSLPARFLSEASIAIMLSESPTTARP